MFREMRRFKQALSPEECIEVLKNEPRGVLSLIGDDGYPYGIPMDHWYCEEDGKLYFHCAREGHKLDALKACSKASYCVYDQGYRKEGEWALNIRNEFRVEQTSDNLSNPFLYRFLQYKCILSDYDKCK